MNVAIIGAGLQCRRRAPVIREWPGAKLAVIASEHLDHAKAQAQAHDCEATTDWKSAATREDIDIVLVCTPPHLHAEMGMAALRAGKHVLCEKPLTRTLAEAEQLVAAARTTGRILKCGFNHRHHPAIRAAHQLLESGALGRPLFARCRYGICGRPGFEKEWRADPARATGGHFAEQGIHAVDLFRWFLGELVEVAGMMSNHYFKEMPLDDGGMAIFRAASGATASLHSTLVQWKNLFSFEVFGEEGYANVQGLGGGYGTEELITGRRDFNAPFQDTVTQYRGADTSWRDEWKEFMTAIQEGRQPMGNGEDGVAALRAALAAYESEKSRRILAIPAR